MEQPDSEANGEQEGSTSRRQTLERLTIGLGVATACTLGIPIAGFVLSPLTKRRADVWRVVGPLERFAVNTTTKVTFRDAETVPWAGLAAESAAWLRREEGDRLLAFSPFCTHVACPIRWEPGAQLFLCPCHGGAFDRHGRVAAGPPPAPLARHPVRVREGLVELRTSPTADGDAG